MTDDLNELEHRLEQELATWADLWPVSCPPEVRDRLREAVRLELNAGWLPGEAARRPANRTIERIRQAVRRELATDGAPGRRGRAGWIWAVSGVAATVALGVGVTWYANRSRPTSSPQRKEMWVRPAEPQLDPVELFAEAARNVWTEDPTVDELRAGVEALEEQLQVRSADDGVQELLDHIDGRIEEIFDQWSAAGDGSA